MLSLRKRLLREPLSSNLEKNEKNNHVVLNGAIGTRSIC